jgi:DNA repair protein SbcD/Mre11
MNSILKVAHFSDLHYGNKKLTEADRCFGAAIDQAITMGAQVAVISGDATDHALDLHAPAAERLLRQVRRLADHCPVLMLQGTFSHEPPGTLSAFKLLGGRHAVHVADRIHQVGLTRQGHWLPSSTWAFEAMSEGVMAVFTCVPTVNKATVALAAGTLDAGAVVGEHLTQLLRGYAPIHRMAQAAGVPTILVSHGTVVGCVNEHGVPMAGLDHEFNTVSLFAAEARAVMLGHIHRHQSWVREEIPLCHLTHCQGQNISEANDQGEGRAGAQCIAYAGSVGRFHHGEAGDKGFLWWEINSDSARLRLIPTPAKRTVDIVFEGKPDLQALADMVKTQPVAGAEVRVRWTVNEEDRNEVDRAAIQNLLKDASACQLEPRILPVIRTRAAGISSLPTLADKVKVWAQVVHADDAALLDCLQKSLTQTVETIAQDVMNQDETTEEVTIQDAVVDEERQGLDPCNFSEKLFPLNLSSTELQRAPACNPCV